MWTPLIEIVILRAGKHLEHSKKGVHNAYGKDAKGRDARNQENFERLCREPAEAALSADSAEEVGREIHDALPAAGKAAFRTFLEAKEEACGIVVSNGETFRFKALIPKSFWTIWGKMELLRKVFQNAPDTKTHLPLDRNWGMARQSGLIRRRSIKPVRYPV